MTVDETTGTLVMQKEPETESSEKSPAPTEASSAPAKARRFAAGRVMRFLRVGAGVWVGLFLVAAGFGLIAYTWGEVAGLLDVSLQLPYLVSGGLTGIGLILLGLLVTNLAVKRREALERSRQMDEIREALVRLRTAIEDEPEE
jgi:hypothetical protein